MSLLGKLTSIGSAALNSDTGKLLQGAAADAAASRINQFAGLGTSADTQSPTAPLQPPTPPAQPAKKSIMDAAWFLPAVGVGIVVLVIVVAKLFGGKKRRK